MAAKENGRVTKREACKVAKELKATEAAKAVKEVAKSQKEDGSRLRGRGGANIARSRLSRQSKYDAGGG